MSRRPHGVVLGALALAVVALPIARIGGAPGVGSFSMFSSPREYRLRLTVSRDDGRAEAVPLRALLPHLSRDARRVIVPAARWRLGETSLELLEGGLGDLAALVCALRPDARRAEVALDVRELDPAPGRGSPISTDVRTLSCARR